MCFCTLACITETEHKTTTVGKIGWTEMTWNFSTCTPKIHRSRHITLSIFVVRTLPTYISRSNFHEEFF